MLALLFVSAHGGESNVLLSRLKVIYLLAFKLN
jgi:hypothetical protein